MEQPGANTETPENLKNQGYEEFRGRAVETMRNMGFDVREAADGTIWFKEKAEKS